MKIKCEYCGNYISDTDINCPKCGAPNAGLIRSAEGVPKTIEELRDFCASHELPLEKMRFFIGEDYKQPKAFGIYREEDGDIVVYKNKADGTRAVRYRGKDEAYAVNELYQKLRAEISQRKGTSQVRPRGRVTAEQLAAEKNRRRRKLLIIGILTALVILLAVSCTVYIMKVPNNGYYSYGGSTYYNDSSTWYSYDSTLSGWYPASADSELTDNYTSYWQGYDYTGEDSDLSFANSEYYTQPASESDSGDWSSDWDDSDWDSDYSDWDSGTTDWDSDW